MKEGTCDKDISALPDHAHSPSLYVPYTARYVQPVVTSVCALCLVQIYQSNSSPHLLLLKALLQCYSSRTFFSLLSQQIEQDRTSLTSVLHHTFANMAESGEEAEEEEDEVCRKCSALVTLLISLANPTSLDKEIAQKTDALFDCVLSLLHCEAIPHSSVISILTRLVQVNCTVHLFIIYYFIWCCLFLRV